MTDQVKTKMTAAEFLELPETTHPTELIEGELIVSPSPVPDHQETLFPMAKHVDSLIPNGKIYVAPMDVYFDDENIPQPDILRAAENGRCKRTNKRLEGSPELIIEILSPGSVRIDRETKFALYERHRVTEYWIVDPVLHYVEVYCMNEGKYVRQGVYEATDTFISPVLGGKMVDLKQVFPQE